MKKSLKAVVCFIVVATLLASIVGCSSSGSTSPASSAGQAASSPAQGSAPSKDTLSGLATFRCGLGADRKNYRPE
ncbi:MAG: hypothetical protein ACOYI4_06930 [Christensenellales bacterium]